MFAWGDLAKLKEQAIAAAAQIQSSATVTAKQYINTYAQQEAEHESSSEEETKEVDIPKHYPAQQSSYQPPLTLSPTKQQNTQILIKDPSSTPRSPADEILKSFTRQAPNENIESTSNSTTENNQTLASFFNVFGKKENSQESTPTTLPNEIKPNSTSQELDSKINNLSLELEQYKQQNTFLKALLESEKTYNANMEQKLKDNTSMLKELTQNLKIVNYLSTRPQSDSTLDHELSSLNFQLKEEIEQLKSQLFQQQQSADEAIFHLKLTLEAQNSENLLAQEKAFKAQLQTMHDDKQSQIQKLEDAAISKKSQFQEEILSLTQLHQATFRAAVQDQQKQLEEVYKQNQAKTIHNAFQQILKKVNLNQLSLNSDSPLDQQVLQFSKVIEEAFGKVDDTLVFQFTTLWNDIQQQSKDLELYYKKARSDSQVWLNQRHQFDQSNKDKNSSIIRLFNSQLTTVFALQQQLIVKDQESENLRETRETLQMQLQRLQKDLNQASTSGLKVQELQGKIQQQDQEKQQLSNRVKDALGEKLAFQLRMQEQEEKLKALITENKIFKDKVAEQDSTLKRYNTELAAIKKVQQQNDELKENLTKQNDQTAQVKNLLQRRESELSQQNQTITNLQRSLTRLQEDMDAMQDDHRTKVRDLNAQVNKNQASLEKAQASIQAIAILEQQLSKEKESKEQLQELMHEYTQRYNEMKEQAEKLTQKFVNEEESRSYLIDRRLINNQLVQYASPKSNYATKMAILNAMSNMMKFTDAEKLELGLIQPEKPKLRESLVSFLLGDNDL